jgi:hypothetical protein
LQIVGGSTVADIRFTNEELALLQSRCARVPAWRSCNRRQGVGGRDVIEIAVDGKRPATLRFSKTRDGLYAVCGFDGWSATLADDLSALLDVVARMLPSAEGVAA